MIADHAKVHQPSSLARTIGCTGWIQMSADIHREETQEAREGTAAHWVLEECTDKYKSNIYVDPYSFENKTAPNGVIVTEEMIDAAVIHFNDVVDTVKNRNHQRANLYIEETVTVPQVHRDMFGTGDTVFYCRVTNTLFVWDFKYGHRSVSAVRNFQLMCYALGAVRRLNINPQSIVMRIVQPRCFDGKGPIREWVTDMNTLHEMSQLARERCEQADGPNAQCTPGPHCRDCPATYRCPALQQSGAVVYDYVQSPVSPIELNDHHLVLEYELLERIEQLIKARKDGVEEDIKRRLKNGVNVPSYSLETSYSREKWTIPAKEVISIMNLLGVDAAKPDVPKTPNQVRQQLKKLKIDASVISAYADKESNGLKLVKDATNRARLIFKESMKNG
jgi:hypothetical protein